MIKVSTFFRQATLLFIALRAADLINLVAGMWIVPKFVNRDDLGAVLPVVTFTTILALPAFAFAFVLMKEANHLAAISAFGRLKSLLKGAFLGTSVLLTITFVLAASAIPFFIESMGIKESSITILATLAAALGCFAPVYQDALNGLKRFGAYGIAEIASATARVAIMLAIMPFRALFGFFAGNAAQPIVRIIASLFALRKELKVSSVSYWSPNPLPRLAPLFFGVLATLTMPMLASLGEQAIVRTALAPEVSAAYYLMTRLTDLLNYLTLPILLVLFPYAAEAAERGESTIPLVLKSTLAALIGAILLGIVYAFCSDNLVQFLARLSTSDTNSISTSAFDLDLLLLINFLTAFQVFYTNAEIAAGRFRFLLWFIPLHLAYFVLISTTTFNLSLQGLLFIFLAFAAIRALCVLYGIIRER